MCTKLKEFLENVQKILIICTQYFAFKILLKNTTDGTEYVFHTEFVQFRKSKSSRCSQFFIINSFSV